MMKLASFLAAWLLAVPAFAQVDCNAGMEPIDASAEFPLSAREFIKVVVANERDFVKALGSNAVLTLELRPSGPSGSATAPPRAAPHTP